MKKFYYVIFLSAILILSACSTAKSGTPIKDFNYMTQDETPLGLEDLKGKVWIANFIYTYCATECPTMTANISQLQKNVKKAGLEDVHFVSFSIDPQVDTPEILKNYGEQFEADFSTWHFLTGYSQEEIENYGPKNFKTVIKKPRDQDYVIHMDLFYLLNKKGEIIANYPGQVDVPFKQILKDIKSALKQ